MSLCAGFHTMVRKSFPGTWGHFSYWKGSCQCFYGSCPMEVLVDGLRSRISLMCQSVDLATNFWPWIRQIFTKTATEKSWQAGSHVGTEPDLTYPYQVLRKDRKVLFTLTTLPSYFLTWGQDTQIFSCVWSWTVSKKSFNKNILIKICRIFPSYTWCKYTFFFFFRCIPSENYFIHLFIHSTNVEWVSPKDQHCVKHWTCPVEQRPFSAFKKPNIDFGKCLT